MQIDEAGRHDQSASVELLVGRAFDLARPSYFGNLAIAQKQVHGRVNASGRVNEMTTLDK